MTRVIHTGDTHIGYRQYHSIERKQDFLAAFRSVIEDAIELEVDAVIHAGDLFHDTRPDLRELMETISVLRQLEGADIPFLGVVGNHERTRDRQWIDLFSDLGLADRLDHRGTAIDEVTFYGLDYVPPAQRDRLDYQFEKPATEAAALVAHGLFEPFAHADWDTEELLSAATVDFDALLLGDNHTPGQARIAGTWATYCGSTERTSAAEREERGYNLVTVDEEVRIARRTIDGTREFSFVDVSLAGTEGADRVIDEVLARDVEEAVVIVRVTGDGEEIRPAMIEEAVASRGALVVRVIDQRDRVESDEPTSEVRFADPDRAVRERIREMELTPAGEMVDSLVRDDSVPDSNVRGRVRNRIESLLAEELDAFHAGATPEHGEREAEEGEESGTPATTRPEEQDETEPSTDEPDNSGEDEQVSIGDFQ